jgi:hypothetical protein
MRDPGWVKIRIRIRDEHPESYHVSESLEIIFLGLKYLNSLIRIRDGKKIRSYIRDAKNFDPG